MNGIHHVTLGVFGVVKGHDGRRAEWELCYRAIKQLYEAKLKESLKTNFQESYRKVFKKVRKKFLKKLKKVFRKAKKVFKKLKKVFFSS